MMIADPTKYSSAQVYEPVAPTIRPTAIGVTKPEILPLKFIAPPRTPALVRPPRIEGMLQKRPTQRRKNMTTERRTTAVVGSATTVTPTRPPITTTLEVPSRVRMTRLAEAPDARHLSAMVPPRISPTKPAPKITKVDQPIVFRSKPLAWARYSGPQVSRP